MCGGYRGRVEDQGVWGVGELKWKVGEIGGVGGILGTGVMNKYERRYCR